MGVDKVYSDDLRMKIKQLKESGLSVDKIRRSLNLTLHGYSQLINDQDIKKPEDDTNKKSCEIEHDLTPIPKTFNKPITITKITNSSKTDKTILLITSDSSLIEKMIDKYLD